MSPRAHPRRVADTIRFIVVGAVLTPIISASIGVATLCAAGVQPWSRFSGLWSAWWLGDALGALVIAPVFLTLARPTTRRLRQDRLESALLILVAVVVTEVQQSVEFQSACPASAIVMRKLLQ